MRKSENCPNGPPSGQCRKPHAGDQSLLALCYLHERETWVEKIPQRRGWQPTLVFLPKESHGQRRLAGYNPWGCKESDTTKQLTHTASIPLGAAPLLWVVSLSLTSLDLCVFCRNGDNGSSAPGGGRECSRAWEMSGSAIGRFG